MSRSHGCTAEPAWKSAVEFEAKGNPESGVGGKRGKSAGPGNLALKLQSGAQSAMGKKGDAALRETGGPGPKTSKMTVGDLDLPRASTSAVAKTSSHAFVALGLVFGMAAFGLGARRYKSKNRTPYTVRKFRCLHLKWYGALTAPPRRAWDGRLDVYSPLSLSALHAHYKQPSS